MEHGIPTVYTCRVSGQGSAALNASHDREHRMLNRTQVAKG